MLPTSRYSGLGCIKLMLRSARTRPSVHRRMQGDPWDALPPTFVTVSFSSFGSTCNFRGDPVFIRGRAAPRAHRGEASGFKGSGMDAEYKRVGVTAMRANNDEKGGNGRESTCTHVWSHPTFQPWLHHL